MSEHKHTIIGMAGHIDHGKTALIKALTGIQTDTHKEEKLRGITIDIGFAYWKDNVTIIDVPGHERFVRNMVAGVSTVDLFLLVIAADDGIMPQTVEHLEILKVFGVKNGIVVINKVDLVDEEWLELITEEIEAFMDKHGYENISVMPVSSISGIGIDALRNAIEDRIHFHKRKIHERPFRLNVDRSFSAKGFGSIVTGTVLSSSVKTGQPLQVLPKKLETKVRGLQVHQREAQEGYSGQRVAVNLAGLDVEQLPRGSVLVKPDAIDVSTEFLAEVHPVQDVSFKIRRHMGVRVHLGTDEVPGKMNWFEEGPFADSEGTYHVLLKLEHASCAAPDDAVLIRSLSPVTTIAGGRILAVSPPRIKREASVWEPYVSALKREEDHQRTEALFLQLGFRTLTAGEIQRRLFQDANNVKESLQKLVKTKRIVDFEFRNDIHYAHLNPMEDTLQLLPDVIGSELESIPYKKGLNFREVKNLVSKYNFSEAFLTRSLQYAINKNVLYFDGERYTTEKLKDSGQMDMLKGKLGEQYLQNRFSVPTIDQLAEKLDSDIRTIKNLTLEMAKEGMLQSIQGQFYLHHKVFRELLDFLGKEYQTKDSLTIGDVKGFTGSTRKYIVPLMEFLDNSGYTIREGDVRKKGSKLN
jgi:selenocysteine-specific elongation factor